MNLQILVFRSVLSPFRAYVELIHAYKGSVLLKLNSGAIEENFLIKNTSKQYRINYMEKPSVRNRWWEGAAMEFATTQSFNTLTPCDS